MRREEEKPYGEHCYRDAAHGINSQLCPRWLLALCRHVIEHRKGFIWSNFPLLLFGKDVEQIHHLH